MILAALAVAVCLRALLVKRADCRSVEEGSIPFVGAGASIVDEPLERRRTLSTKNLARTVIEGGRTWYSIFERRRSSKLERQHVRFELRALRLDLELWDELALTPRKPVRRDFADKLAPAYRFLSSRAGKKWNESPVGDFPGSSYSLLRQRFDDRTTAGRHILFCHLLDSVEHVGEHHHSKWIPHRGKFVVDEQGVLRKVTRPAKKKRPGVSLPVLMECRLRFTKPIVLGSIPSGEAVRSSSLSRWIASVGLLNRFDLVRFQTGRRRAPCLAGSRASVS